MKSYRISLVVLLVALWGLTSHGFAAGPVYFLTLPGVPGDTRIKGHEHDIAATGFQFVVEASGNTTFLIKKAVDSTTTDLIAAINVSPTDTPATFSGEKSAAATAKYFTMVFSNVTVLSSEIADDGALASTPVETVTFAFTQVVITYFNVQPSGKPGTPKAVTVIKNAGG